MALIREILKGIAEQRKVSMTSRIAKGKGLQRKPGFGNYGPKGSNLITTRSAQGQLKNVPLHPIGTPSIMKGVYALPVHHKVR